MGSYEGTFHDPQHVKLLLNRVSVNLIITADILLSVNIV